MIRSGKRWTVHDRDGNAIYLTEERWAHIIDEANHVEMIDYEELIKTTIRQGKRRQEPLNPRKYRYYRYFTQLPDEVNHIVAIVLFGVDVDGQGHAQPNNFVTTAFFKHIQVKE